LPVCSREIEIVTELAKAGSRNHQILLRLLEKGATIMGTESSELLVEEYELVKQILATGDTSSIVRMANNQKALSESVLRRRDQCIADRINKTLRAGETGIIFLGLLHALGRWLDKDIQVIYPVGTPFPGRLNP
jgi:Na+/phosphate symporter